MGHPGGAAIHQLKITKPNDIKKTGIMAEQQAAH